MFNINWQNRIKYNGKIIIININTIDTVKTTYHSLGPSNL